MFNSCEKRKINEDGTHDHDAASNNRQMLPSIFVKIPLEINQQYQRQNSNRQQAIKAEVKFESNDPSVLQANLKTPTPPASTPTPPTTSSTPDRLLSNTTTSTIFTSHIPSTTSSPNLDTAAIKCYRCEICPFLSINQDNLYTHIEKHTQRKFVRKKYFCAGCDNIFYEKTVLERHLLEDHMMDEEESSTLVEHILKNNPFGPSRKGKGKNRIFIKNVTQLKKPDLIEASAEQSNGDIPKNKPKSKIFVKSVQYLKGPEYCFRTDHSPIPTNGMDQNITNTNSFSFNSSDTTPPPPPFTSLYNSHTLQSTLNTQEPYYHSEEGNSLPDFAAIVSESTTISEPIHIPAQTSTSGKIFLRDLSALQHPRPNLELNQPTEQRHPTLHLKTVDELNSMSITEVQNLQVLNTDNTFQNYNNNNSNHNIDQPLNDLSLPEIFPNNDDVIVLDENEISDLIQLNNVDGNYTQSSFSDLLTQGLDLSAIEDGKKLEPAKPLECDTDPLGATNDLNSETLRVLSVEDVTINEKPEGSVLIQPNILNQEIEDDNDEDILFVCAQEIINASMEEDDKKQDTKKTRDLETPVPTTQKPRIYVATNLMEAPSNDSFSQILELPKSRGRPKGSRGSGVSKWRKSLPENVTEDDVLGPKCNLAGCALRFKIPKNMEYHKQCHVMMTESEMICPECKSTEFRNWNSLHTHLWRTHKIDMELYSCDKCNFKTPILARLNSEHMKIHSDRKDFICNLCGRAFKNVKQRKHHVRLHRLKSKTPATVPKPTVVEKAASVSVEKLKKYRCTECNYESNDHNALRRHKFQHSTDKNRYKCPFCSYTSIQSTTYRKHLERKHEDKAAHLIFKCNKGECKFTTINKVKYEFHVASHIQQEGAENQETSEIVETCEAELINISNSSSSLSNNLIYETSSPEIIIINPPQANVSTVQCISDLTFPSAQASNAILMPGNKIIFEPSTNTAITQNRTKIKVKNNMLLTDPIHLPALLNQSRYTVTTSTGKVSQQSSLIKESGLQNIPMIRPALFASNFSQINADNSLSLNTEPVIHDGILNENAMDSLHESAEQQPLYGNVATVCDVDLT